MNYQWIIGILIAVLIPVIIFYLQRPSVDLKTETFYFAEQYNSSQDINKLPDINCWTHSASTNRSDAYRCMDSNYIYDPCFEPPFNHEIVICPNKPDNSDSLYFKIDSNGLPIEKDFDFDSHPWFIKLYNGEDCRFVTGASPLIGGMRMDYTCNMDETNNFLLLPITQVGNLMKIKCYIDNKIQECDIKEVWY